MSDCVPADGPAGSNRAGVPGVQLAVRVVRHLAPVALAWTAAAEFGAPKLPARPSRIRSVRVMS